jgi:putative OPT family oligopeptide transporter
VIGILVGLVLAGANMYVGLRAGMTVSASIPSAVVSIGILRLFTRKGTILENCIAQTIGSTGEALAAGIIFTVPALLFTGVWTKFDYWTVTLIALLGGSLGVLFMIPLRRTLIVEEKELRFPEGVACAEVLRAGEGGGRGALYLLVSTIFGAVFITFIKLVALIKETLSAGWAVRKAVFGIAGDVSPMLIGVGYIVGFNIAVLVFIGGAIAWLVAIPIYTAVTGAQVPQGTSIFDFCAQVRSAEIRYMGVGAMVIGGISSIIRMRRGIGRAIKSMWREDTGKAVTEMPRTERDMGMSLIVIFSLITVVAIFLLYWSVTGRLGTSVISTIAMAVAGFFFVAVASYIVGLVGSSNSPVSGMTICTLLFASGLLLLCGITGTAGILAVLIIAGVVCCAASTAGDISQDLKTGHLVGSTPWKQQAVQLLSVGIFAFVIGPVLILLHTGYKIGSDSLPAPQARLFEGISQAIFTQPEKMPWIMLTIGVCIGLVLLAADEALKRKNAKFRLYVMPTAVGIYLPINLSVPILIGGFLSLILNVLAKRRGEQNLRDSIQRGVIFCSGLIAGEALIGIAVAGVKSFARDPEIYPIALFAKHYEASAMTLASFLAIAVTLIAISFVSLKGRRAKR